MKIRLIPQEFQKVLLGKDVIDFSVAYLGENVSDKEVEVAVLFRAILPARF